jgi:hypothetical protein
MLNFWIKWNQNLAGQHGVNLLLKTNLADGGVFLILVQSFVEALSEINLSETFKELLEHVKFIFFEQMLGRLIGIGNL